MGFAVDGRWDYENGFYLTSGINRLAKIVAHYELYKSIVKYPGHVVECGVYKGASLIRFATFREILESPESRKIIGFDAFGKFPAQNNAGDALYVKHFEAAGGDGITITELQEVFAYKSITNFELVQGDIVQTVPGYVSEHPELKISLLHIDVDVCKPTVVILKHLFDRVVPGGLVVFDNYGTVAGETKVIDEYIRGRNLVLEKLSLAHVPSFIRV